MAIRRHRRGAPSGINAWSFSRLTTWEKCPFQAKLQYIDRIPNPPNEAMLRGKNTHSTAEAYIIGTKPSTKVPKDLEKFQDLFKNLRKINKTVEVEKQIALTEKWGLCDWFGSDAWLRVVIDCMWEKDDTLFIIDWKTGKVRESHEDQLDLYAIVGFIMYPHVKEVDAAMAYLDSGDEVGKVYSLKEVAALKKNWIKRAKPMLSDRTFKANPTRLCDWCPYGQKNFKPKSNAPCKF